MNGVSFGKLWHFAKIKLCRLWIAFYRDACNADAIRILLSVCLSVCQTRDLWQNGRKIGPDFYILQKII